MESQSNQNRIKAIYQMLFEMATGNLTFRLTISEHDDELDRLSKILNLLAADFHAVILQSGYINSHFSYQNLIQTTFILNNEFLIISFNSEVAETLHYKPDELFEVEFENLIANQSIPVWNDVKQQVILDSNYHNTIQLILITGNKKVLPAFCTISRLLYSDKILISSVTTILNDLIDDAQHSFSVTHFKTDEAVVIQKLYDYILSHLQDPLPTLKELSVLFDTNEYKLKQGFRELFKTSIYNFYHEERLKRAHLMIQQTKIPLKEIALMNGFNTYLNFYKAFKKRFKYTPTDVERSGKEPDQ
jgi:AraC-like DNA-binding protein